MSRLETEDLISFGLIPEFIGRVPVMAVLEELDEGMLMDALTKPKNAVTKQYKALFRHNSVDLIFEEEGLLEIAKQAIKKKVGARGLRPIVVRGIVYE